MGMFEVFFRIWFLVAILPVLIATRGYEIFKEYLKKRNLPMDWIYFVYAALIVLVIILIVLLGMGYR